jgi:tetratricopeptide (TPR) repeat protein
VFWKIVNVLVRIIFFRRFRQADKVGEAARLLGQGRSGEALARLDAIAPKLHGSLVPIHALTRGMALDCEGRLDEAEDAFCVASNADPQNPRPDLELAVLLGRRFRFDEARALLEKARAKADEGSRDKVDQIAGLLDQVVSGEREAEFKKRARAMAQKPIAEDGRAAGLPPDLTLIDDWIERAPDEARRQADEIALLIGQGLVRQGAQWRVSLGISDSLVVLADGFALNPFDVVAERLQSRGASLQSLIDANSRPNSTN